ncbi:phage tail fiber protein [Nitratireductor pacificus pht-3B]|uniref:Phage tail fiber protein n=1 Tax=Nitratireductor pacificus pht-3B TaxID=391937 RepID=K2LH08_9HYPH|nr:phage tail fiber protein [Nitratireductor pacificus pht-3B]
MFFWTILLLLASVSLAHAGPLAGLIGLLTSTTIGKVLLSIALKVGMSLLQRLMMKNEEPQQPGIKTRVGVGGDKTMSFIVGTYATAGHMVYANTWGKVRSTPNAAIAQVISLSDLPVSAISNEVWMRGRKIVRDPGLGDRPGSFAWFGATSYPFSEFVHGDHPGIYWLFAKYFPEGRAQPDPNLIATFGGAGARAWNANMVGRGVAYVILTAEFNRDLFRDRPEAIWQVSGLPLYDPRQDDTAGGTGTQRWGEPETYAFTDNPAVIIYNILRGIRYEGELVFGGEIPASRLPPSNWFAAMNECDVVIDGERQFRCGYEIKPFDQSPLSVIEELLKSCTGRMAEIGGVYKIHVGAPALPSYYFSDDAIAITEDQSIDPYPGLEQTFNGVSATYPEPAAAWAMKDAPRRIDQAFVDADDGRELVAAQEFNAVPFPIQVQRLQKALMEDNRRFRRHRHTLPPEAWLLEPLDTVSWSSAHNGYVDKLFLISAMDDLENANQAVSLQEVDPRDYSWTPATDKLPYTVGPMGPIEPAPQVMYDWTAAPASVPDNDGQPRRPAILLGWYGAIQDTKGVEFEVRLAVSAEVIYRGRTDQVLIGQLMISQGLLPSTDYQVRGRYLPYSNRKSLWGGWLAVRTPDVKFDVYLDIDFEGLNQVIGERNEFVEFNVREAIERAIDNATSDFADFDQQYGQIQKLRREATASFEGLTASYKEAVLVVATETEALAQRLEILEVTVDEDIAQAVDLLTTEIATVEGQVTALSDALTSVSAKVDGVSASGTFRVQSGASPGDGWARAALQVSADNGVTFEQASIFLDARTSGAPRSRAVLDAENLFFGDLSSGSVVNPLVYSAGVWRMNLAHIGTVTAGMILGTTGKTRFELDNDRFVVGD